MPPEMIRRVVYLQEQHEKKEKIQEVSNVAAMQLVRDSTNPTTSTLILPSYSSTPLSFRST